ncbi:VOC family protein [Streptacidiphilus sp. N1-3]|uniref:VOC family protein n=1 Tax=Streptacidiphilus alkalitolerans TaxID=3342712 RepID=A0ABV6WZN6_9ACTN
MSISVIGVSYDAAQPATIAEFWAQALGRKLSDGASADFAAIAATDPATSGPFLMFHRVPEGKTVKNRLHLDLSTADPDAETQRLLALGATRLSDTTEDGRIRWTTFADPEGNEFDLVNAQ